MTVTVTPDVATLILLYLCQYTNLRATTVSDEDSLLSLALAVASYDLPEARPRSGDSSFDVRAELLYPETASPQRGIHRP